MKNSMEKVVPFLPLICMLIGQGIYYISDSLYPERSINYYIEIPKYKSKTIKYQVNEINPYFGGNLKKLRTTKILSVERDSLGKPVIEKKEVTKTISGPYEIVLKRMVEIYDESLGKPQYKSKVIYISSGSSTQFPVKIFYPNIIRKGTGVYYAEKEIVRTGWTMTDYSILGASIGTAISLFLVIRRKINNKINNNV